MNIDNLKLLVVMLATLACVRALPPRTNHLQRATIIRPKQLATSPREGQDRQIQPLSCVSATTGDAGICMFAWNCVEAGGHHLGTCIDRFYFGSCCKLPEVIGTNELGPGQAPDGIIPTDLDQGQISNEIIPQAGPENQIGNVEQPAVPVDIPTSSTTEGTTPETTTTSTSTTTTTTSTTTTITTTTTEETTTTTTATSTSTSTSTTTLATTTVTTTTPALSEPTESETVPNTTPESSQAETSPSTEISDEILSESEPATEGENVENIASPEIPPSEAVVVEEEEESQSNIVPNDSEDTSPAVDDTPSEPSQPVATPEQPVLPAVTPEIPSDLMGDKFEEKPLQNMTRLEACGRRPWFSVKNHEQLYPSGVRNGASEAPMSHTVGVQRSLERGGRRNSKFLRSWNRKGRIVNGQTADYGEWPWQVSLRQWRTATYLHKCGCALLSENWAITAAHCVENVAPDDLLLRMGEYDLNSMGEPQTHVDRRVQIVASHPKFDPKTFEYDLALLRFYEPVEFQPNVVPICIPEDDATLVGETAWVTGWGRLYEDGPLPSVMQEVDLPIINNTQCERMYRDAGYVEHIPSIFICAGYAAGGKDSCEGDSGGPMVVQRSDGRFMLSGVISWGIGCAEKNQPGVYTRISEFRDWINQILQF